MGNNSTSSTPTPPDYSFSTACNRLAAPAHLQKRTSWGSSRRPDLGPRPVGAFRTLVALMMRKLHRRCLPITTSPPRSRPSQLLMRFHILRSAPMRLFHSVIDPGRRWLAKHLHRLRRTLEALC